MKLLARLVFLLLLLGAGYGLFLYTFGYWENLPVFDTLSGPMQYRRLVSETIPEAVYDLQGGYSGFPQGMIYTRFRFKGDFRKIVPAQWKPLPVDQYPSLVNASETHGQNLYVYKKQEPGEKSTVEDKESGVYLIGYPAEHRGLLYAP